MHGRGRHSGGGDMVTVGIYKGKSSLNDHCSVEVPFMLIKGIYLDFQKALAGSTFEIYFFKC